MVSLNDLVEFLLEVDETVGVDVSSMHPNRQIVALKETQSVLFVFQEVLPFRHLRDLQFLQACLVFKALLNSEVDFIIHFDELVFIAGPFTTVVAHNKSIFGLLPWGCRLVCGFG